jgi:putative endonuclease
MLLPWVRKKLLADPHRLGRWGQNRAETFLKRHRLRTLARNFAFSGGELDLVMGDDNGTIVFVEVKTRRDETFILAVAAVNAKKRRHITRTAKCFLKQFKISDRPLRFDIVTVILGDRGKPQIQHYPNAFVA